MVLPQPVLHTERLELSALRLEDGLRIFQLHLDEQVQQYLNREAPANVEASIGFIHKILDGQNAGRWYYWGLRMRQDPALIGTICLWQFSADRSQAEIGFDLLPAYQKKGLMQEAVTCILAFATQRLQLQKVTAMVNGDNKASIKLLVRNDFFFVRVLSEEEKFTGEEQQVIRSYERLSQ